MSGGCVIVVSLGLCAAALSTGCAGSNSPTAPTEATRTAVSLNADRSTSTVTAGLAQSSRDEALVPFEGSLEGEYGAESGMFPVLNESITGGGNATHLGRYTLAMEETVNFLNGSATGTVVLTAANGDTVSARYTGQGQPKPPLVSIREEATITGGTGRFATASGSFVIDRVFDPAQRTTTGSFKGSMSSTGASSH
jgi:hypothetical protein